MRAAQKHAASTPKHFAAEPRMLYVSRVQTGIVNSNLATTASMVRPHAYVLVVPIQFCLLSLSCFKPKAATSLRDGKKCCSNPVFPTRVCQSHTQYDSKMIWQRPADCLAHPHSRQLTRHCLHPLHVHRIASICMWALSACGIMPRCELLPKRGAWPGAGRRDVLAGQATEVGHRLCIEAHQRPSHCDCSDSHHWPGQPDLPAQTQ